MPRSWGTRIFFAFASLYLHLSHWYPLFLPSDFMRLPHTLHTGFSTSKEGARSSTDRYSTFRILGCLVVPFLTPTPISIRSPASSVITMFASPVGSYTADGISAPPCSTVKMTCPPSIACGLPLTLHFTWPAV